MRATTVFVTLMFLAAPLFAAPSYVGPTGAIMTPDAMTVPQSGFDIGFHHFFDFLSDSNVNVNVLHGNIGLAPNIEVGLSVVDFNDDRGRNDDSGVAINGKWRILDENATRPSIALGVMDVASDAFDRDDPSFYFLISKNLTPFAEQAMQGQSKPLRGTIGVGSGFYDGLFGSLNWVMTDKLSAILEFASIGGGDSDTVVNGGLRYSVGPGIRLDGAVIDFDELAVGISLTKGF